MKKKQKNKTKKIKIKYKRVILFILITIFIVLFIMHFINLRIKNVYIENNSFLSDQEIIDIAFLSDYPKTIFTPCSKLKKDLENNIYIKSATVHKENLTKVIIKVEENYPLFFYKPENKTILLDGTMVDSNYDVPEVINYVPNLKYQDLVEKMGLLNSDILERISEIKYDPSDYDDERFLLYMNDSNYVYINLYKFENLNKYIDIVKNFGNKKGIVYLDSGNYFEIKEN